MNGFVRKRVQSSTLGEKLKQYRCDRRISLNEAAKNTNIQVKYLESLEKSDYDNLPPDVYSKGFLRTYAEYLGISPKKAVNLFEKEKGIQKNIRKEPENKKGEKRLKISRFIITPKIIGSSIVSVVVLLAFFYLYSEFDNFVSTPRLVIKRPLLTHETISDSHIYFEGVTDKDNEIMINGKKIMVNDQGVFSSDVSLQRGVNVIVVKAINRFEKESKKEFFINSETKEDQVDDDLDEKDEFDVEIRAVDIPVKVSVFEDDKEIYVGVVYPEFSQKIKTNGDFFVSSENGFNTLILIDGEERGSLSELQDPIEKVFFEIKNNK